MDSTRGDSPREGMDHVGIRAADLQSSVNFYRQMLIGVGTSIADSGSDVGRVDLVRVGPESGMVELFEHARGQAPEGANDVGIIHFAVGVPDVDAAYERAIAAGARPMEGPRSVVLALQGGAVVRAAFVMGPDGEVIELIEHRWAARFFPARPGA